MKTYQGRTKFTGSFDQDVEEALETFETFANVCQLNEAEKERALPFMLDQGALLHFTDTFGGKTYTCKEVITILNLGIRARSSEVDYFYYGRSDL